MRQAHPNALIFAGTSHPALAKAIAKAAGLSLGSIKIESFPDGETSIEVLEDVKERKVFFVQSVVHQPNHYLMEMLIAVDAFKRASAGKVTVIVPYLGYCRQDKKNGSLTPISAKLVANLLTEAGVDNVITMDLHAEQVQGFFDIPVDHLHGRSLLIEAVKQSGFIPEVVVAPDLGSVKIARSFAEELQVDFAVIDKHRTGPSHVEVLAIVGDIKNKNVLLADDMCSTGGTLASAAKACQEEGKAKIVHAACTHPVLLESALARLQASGIEKLHVTDTIALSLFAASSPMISLASTARLFAAAMK